MNINAPWKFDGITVLDSKGKCPLTKDNGELIASAVNAYFKHPKAINQHEALTAVARAAEDYRSMFEKHMQQEDKDAAMTVLCDALGKLRSFTQ